jgi:tetratricopeptide (TPR) repeat protein
MKARERHAKHFLQVLENCQAEHLIPGNEEMEQVRRAWNWVLGKGDFQEATLAFVWAGWPLLEQQARWTEAVEWLKEGIAAAEILEEKHDKGALWSNLGAVYRSLGERKTAWECYQKALSIFKEINDQECQPKVLNGLGLLAQAENRSEEALGYYNEALELFTVVNDLDGQASILNNIGEIYQQHKQFEKALPLYEKCLQLRRDQNEPTGIALALCNLAVIQRLRFDSTPTRQRPAMLEQVGQLYQEALGLFKQTGELYFQAVVLTNLSELYQHFTGEDRKVVEYAGLALKLYDEIEEPVHAATVLANLGTYYGASGDQTKALTYDWQALERYRRLEQPLEVATLYLNIAYRHQMLWELDEALLYNRQALAIYRELKYPIGQAQALEKLGWVYLLQHKFVEARHFLNPALQIYRSEGSLIGEARTLNQIALSHAYVDDKEQALLFYKQALELADQLGDEAFRDTIVKNMSRHNLSLNANL